MIAYDIWVNIPFDIAWFYRPPLSPPQGAYCGPLTMLSKSLANGLVILAAAGLSLLFVLQWRLQVPIAGSTLLFLGDPCFYALFPRLSLQSWQERRIRQLYGDTSRPLA
jgi:hypothetical protein